MHIETFPATLSLVRPPAVLSPSTTEMSHELPVQVASLIKPLALSVYATTVFLL